MKITKYNFGNVVVVEENLIGIIVKCWENNTYDVYVRYYSTVREYPESEIRHFIYDKVLEEDDYL